MSTKSDEIRKQFATVFDHIPQQEKMEHDAQVIMFKFLSEIEKLAIERGIKSRKELAKMAGITPSYLTQLFRGNKKLNFETIAKIQQALDVTFDIHAVVAGVPSQQKKSTPQQVPLRKLKPAKRKLAIIERG